MVAYGIGNSPSGIESWRLLFLVLGGITSGYAIILFFILPDSPAKAAFLTESERRIALQRTLKNKTGTTQVTEAFDWSQVAAAAKDPQAWCLVLYTFCVNLANGGLTSVRDFDPDIVRISTHIYIVLRNHCRRLWILKLRVPLASNAYGIFPASIPHYNCRHCYIHPIITDHGHDFERGGGRDRSCFNLHS